MSIVITKDVFCDGDGCANWTAGVTGRTAVDADARWTATVEGAYGRFKRAGRTVDLCPECQTPAERKRVAARRAVLYAEHEAQNAADGITYVSAHAVAFTDFP